jgi:hypothetical protein
MRWARRFQDQSLLQRLVMEPKLRIGVGAIVFILILAPLSIAKLWTTSPKDFNPKVKVSLLDRLQVISLRRSAVKFMAAADYEKASISWQAAVANNAADANLLRGAFTNFLLMPKISEKDGQAMVKFGLWLLRLNHTNRLDAILTGQAFARHQYYELADQILSQLKPPLDQAAEIAWLKVLFHRRDMPRFTSHYRAFRERQLASPEIELYYAAWQMGWGPLAGSSEGKRKLESALGSSDQTALAHQLLLAVGQQLGQADVYKRSLDWLVDHRLDTLHNHVLYWNILADSGQAAAARRLAEDWTRIPATVNEAIELYWISRRLGLQDQAHQIVKLLQERYQEEAAAWLTIADFFIVEKRWEDLRAVATDIRLQPGISTALEGVCFFLEGRAALGMDQSSAAKVSFQRAAKLPFGGPLGMHLAKSLLQYGYPVEAQEILHGIEIPFQGDLEYWLLLVKTSVLTRDENVLAMASARAYQLAPDNPAIINNYAAALILQNKNLAQAIQLTLWLLDRYPESLDAQLNQALALVKSQRLGEAKVNLDKLQPESLSPSQLNTYYQAQFYYFCAQNQRAEARTALGHLDKDDLFPRERKEIERLAQNLSGEKAEVQRPNS